MEFKNACAIRRGNKLNQKRKYHELVGSEMVGLSYRKELVGKNMEIFVSKNFLFVKKNR